MFKGVFDNPLLWSLGCIGIWYVLLPLKHMAYPAKGRCILVESSSQVVELVGSISAALSCLVYPPREETAGRVSGKPCLWRQFLIKILAVPMVVTNVIWFQSLAGLHDAYGS